MIDQNVSAPAFQQNISGSTTYESLPEVMSPGRGTPLQSPDFNIIDLKFISIAAVCKVEGPLQFHGRIFKLCIFCSGDLSVH